MYSWPTPMCNAAVQSTERTWLDSDNELKTWYVRVMMLMVAEVVHRARLPAGIQPCLLRTPAGRHSTVTKQQFNKEINASWTTTTTTTTNTIINNNNSNKSSSSSSSYDISKVPKVITSEALSAVDLDGKGEIKQKSFEPRFQDCQRGTFVISDQTY